MLTHLLWSYKDYYFIEKAIRDQFDYVKGLRRTDPARYKEERAMLDALFAGIQCPNPACQACDQMRLFGFYKRYVTFLINTLFWVETMDTEIIRLQCKSCNTTHALLPLDIIPYWSPTIDSLLLTNYVYFENPTKPVLRKAVKMMPISRASQLAQAASTTQASQPVLLTSTPQASQPVMAINTTQASQPVIAASSSQVPQPVMAASVSQVSQSVTPSNPLVVGTLTPTSTGSTLFDIRKHFTFFGTCLFGDGHIIPKSSMTRSPGRDYHLFSISTLYFYRMKIKAGWDYVVSTFRYLGVWNMADSPTLEEGIRLFFSVDLVDIQEGMFRIHGMPFLYPVSRRSMTSFPYTGCAI